MAQPSTFIKLDRNIRNWRWYQDANTARVFIDLLLDANISDRDFMGITIHRGETATSYASIGGRLNLTIRNVRTAISHLKLTGEVTVKRYAKFQVITLVNYDRYQRIPTGKAADNRQSTDSQLTINRQQLKNNKNIRNKERKEKKGGRAAGFTMEGFAEFLHGGGEQA